MFNIEWENGDGGHVVEFILEWSLSPSIRLVVSELIWCLLTHKITQKTLIVCDLAKLKSLHEPAATWSRITNIISLIKSNEHILCAALSPSASHHIICGYIKRIAWNMLSMRRNGANAIKIKFEMLALARIAISFDMVVPGCHQSTSTHIHTQTHEVEVVEQTMCERLPRALYSLPLRLTAIIIVRYSG